MTDPGDLTPQDILNSSEEFIRENGRNATAEEMAERLQVTVEVFRQVMEAQVQVYKDKLTEIKQVTDAIGGNGPKPNRAQRRAQLFGHRGALGRRRSSWWNGWQ